MLKLAKCFARPRSPLAYNLVPRQYFTMPSWSNDTWIQDISSKILGVKYPRDLARTILVHSKKTKQNTRKSEQAFIMWHQEDWSPFLLVQKIMVQFGFIMY